MYAIVTVTKLSTLIFEDRSRRRTAVYAQAALARVDNRPRAAPPA